MTPTANWIGQTADRPLPTAAIVRLGWAGVNLSGRGENCRPRALYFEGGQKNPTQPKLAQGDGLFRVYERGDLTARRRDCAPGRGGCQRGLGTLGNPNLNRGDILARGGWDDINRGTRKGRFHMLRLTREDGQTVVGMTLALLPLGIAPSLFIAVFAMAS